MSYNRNNNYNNRNNRSNNSNQELADINQKIDKLEMLKDMKTKDYADENGYAFIVAKNSRNLNTNQLRKFFASVKKFEQKDSWDEIEPEFYLLKPQLAAAVGRKNIPKSFYKIIMTCMKKVDIGENIDKMENIKTFVKFYESIVAYHKFLE